MIFAIMITNLIHSVIFYLWNYVINFFYIGNNYSHTHTHTHTPIIHFFFRNAYDLEINNSRQGHHFYDITIELNYVFS